MKKILLALAVASASSLFAGYQTWFDAKPNAAIGTTTWLWTGEDGSIITNSDSSATFANGYWEIDADVTRTAVEDITLFTPNSATDPCKSNTITKIEIATTFDAMYDMTTDGEGALVGEDQPVTPQDSLGALIVGCVTNNDGVVVSSNYYAYVGASGSQNWVQLFGDAAVPADLTGTVVNVKVDLLYLGGVNEMRFFVGNSALTNAAGASLFVFTPKQDAQSHTIGNVQNVQFSGCGKVSQLVADMRTTEHLDGGQGTELDPYVISSSDSLIEWEKMGDSLANCYFNITTSFTIDTWSSLSPDTSRSFNVTGSNGATITVNNLTGSSFFGKVNGATFKGLTINVNNASDNTSDVAVFVTEAGDSVNFENCVAGGTLYNTAADGLLAGFVLTNKATGVDTVSATFKNCAVTAELDNGTTGDSKNYNNCFAFSGYIAKGVVAAALDDDGQVDGTLKALKIYEPYGDIAVDSEDSALGSVNKALNFATYGTDDQAAYAFYTVPTLSTTESENDGFYVMHANADSFYFEEEGSLKLINTAASCKPPYTGTITESAELATADTSSDSDNFYLYTVGTCVATLEYTNTESESITNKYPTLKSALAAAASLDDLGGEEVATVALSVENVTLLGNAIVGPSVVLALSEQHLNLAENVQLAVQGTFDSDDDNISEQITFGQGSSILLNATGSFNPCWSISESPYIAWYDGNIAPSFISLNTGAQLTIKPSGDGFDYALSGAEDLTDATVNDESLVGENDTLTFADADAVFAFADEVEASDVVPMFRVASSLVSNGDGVAYDDVNNIWYISDAYASIDANRAYETFENAIFAVKDDDTVTLLSGVQTESEITITNAVTINVQEYDLGLEAALTIDAADKTVTITTTSEDGLLTDNENLAVVAGTLDISAFVANSRSISISAGAKLIGAEESNPNNDYDLSDSEEGAFFQAGPSGTLYSYNGSEWAEYTGTVTLTVPDLTDKYVSVVVTTNGETALEDAGRVQVPGNTSYEVTWTATNSKFFEDGTGEKVESGTATSDTTFNPPTVYGTLTQEGGIYQVTAVADIVALKAGVAGNKYASGSAFAQTADISLSDGFAGIGTEEVPFTGIYNGGGFTITAASLTGDGFFNYVKGAVISNLTLTVSGGTAIAVVGTATADAATDAAVTLEKVTNGTASGVLDSGIAFVGAVNTGWAYSEGELTANMAYTSVGTTGTGSVGDGFSFATVAESVASYISTNDVTYDYTLYVMRSNSEGILIKAPTDRTSVETVIDTGTYTYSGLVSCNTVVDTMTGPVESGTTRTYTTQMKAGTEEVFVVNQTVDEQNINGSVKIGMDIINTLNDDVKSYTAADMSDSTKLAQVQSALGTEGDNGLKHWQNIVLGLTTSTKKATANDLPTAEAKQTANADKIEFNLGNVSIQADTGAKVHFVRVENDAAVQSVEGTSTMSIDLSTEFPTATKATHAKVKHYKFKVVVEQGNATTSK